MLRLPKRSLRILFYLTLLLSPVFLFAEQTILLRKGGKVVGDVVAQNEKTITVQSESGRKVLNKREILKIIYKDISKEEENRIRKEEEKKIQENPQVVEEPLVIPAEPAKTEPSRSRWSVVWRSAIVPGWGQWYAGNKKEALVTGALFLGAVGYGASSRQAAESAKSSYDSAVFLSGPVGTSILGGGVANLILITEVPSSRANYESSIQTYNSSVYALGAVYLAQLVRSYFVGRSWEQEANPITWGVYPKPEMVFGRLGWGAEASVQVGF